MKKHTNNSDGDKWEPSDGAGCSPALPQDTPSARTSQASGLQLVLLLALLAPELEAGLQADDLFFVIRGIFPPPLEFRSHRLQLVLQRGNVRVPFQRRLRRHLLQGQNLILSADKFIPSARNFVLLLLTKILDIFL